LPAFAIAAPRDAVHPERMRRSRSIAPILAVAALAAPAAADAPRAERPRILVLPLPPSHAIDPAIARAFDARLLVALDDTRRVVTVTPSDEPECTSTSCLAAMGVAADAAFVLSMTAVREADGLTLFGTLVDAKTAAAARRIELARIDPARLARRAPAELVPQIVAAGAAAAPAARAPTVLGIARPATAHARAAVLAIHDRLAAYRTFKVVPLDGADRSTLTHRAELVIDELSVVDRRRGLCTWHDGTLAGTLAIIDLSNGRAVFTRTVRLAESQRALTSNRERVVDALLEAAVADWMAAFHASRLEARLRRAPAR
jgi:hypothetical protein